MKLAVIIKKELIDQIRDKRTIVASILLPALIVPLLLFITTHNTSNDNLSEPLRIIIPENENYIKSIILGSFSNTRFISPELSLEKISNGKADLQIDATKSDGKYKTLTIQYDPVRKASSLSYIRIYDIIKTHFNESGLPSGGLDIKSLPIRNDKENKTLLTLSLMLPVLLMVFAASSAMSGIIDMSAGEKERSTLEILLSCNVSFTEIVLGKILAASIIGFTAILSLITGLSICSHLYPGIIGGLSLVEYCGSVNIFLLAGITAFSVFLFSSAGMAIGLFARSVKEGTILILPVIVLCSALSSGLIAGDPFSINKLYLLIPVLNSSFLIRSVIFNNVDVLMLTVTALVNLAYAVLFIIISRGLLKNESVIFRS